VSHNIGAGESDLEKGEVEKAVKVLKNNL